MSIRERTELIERLQQEFDLQLERTERELLELLLSNADELLVDARKLNELFAQHSQSNATLVALLGQHLIDIFEANVAYFEAISSSTSGVIDAQYQAMLTAFGISANGTLESNGYLYLLQNDNSVQRKILNYITSSATSKIESKAFREGFKSLVVSTEESTGLVKSLYEGLEVQPHYDADRLNQDGFGTALELHACLYTGGTIATSRPFCVRRNGKVFLDSEIELFGTPFDKYGGYSDRKTGYFQGKPKSGYNPFRDLGGYRCRHFLNRISNEEALRRRDDLRIVDGKLVAA